ncbi:MAG: hypothetical protein WBM35_15070 [Candidatus Electrothrix sp.]
MKKFIFVILFSVAFWGQASLAAQVVSLNGNWVEKSSQEHCIISQNGNNLSFSNYGGTGSGQIKSASFFSTTGWGGGAGTITNNGNTIIWKNGYVWNRKIADTTLVEPLHQSSQQKMNLSGNWVEKSSQKHCVISQNGNNLSFSNYGGTGSGQIKSASSLSTTGWGGGAGTITNNGNTIIWKNGYVWNRK